MVLTRKLLLRTILGCSIRPFFLHRLVAESEKEIAPRTTVDVTKVRTAFSAIS